MDDTRDRQEDATGAGAGKAPLLKREEVQAAKDAACRTAQCPEYGKGNPNCAKCTGPVQYRDANGHLHGRARSCHNCRNAGLGLPVCWHSCPGPNQDFAADGQDMVTLGSFANPDNFLAAYGEDGLGNAPEDPDDITLSPAPESDADAATDGDSVIDAMTDEPDDPRHAYENSVTERLTAEAETACRVILSTVLSLEKPDLLLFYYLYRGHTAASAAKKMGISKQAANIRKNRLAREHKWMRAFIHSLGLREAGGGGGNRGRSRNSDLYQADLFTEQTMAELRSDTYGTKLADCDAFATRGECR